MAQPASCNDLQSAKKTTMAARCLAQSSHRGAELDQQIELQKSIAASMREFTMWSEAKVEDEQLKKLQIRQTSRVKLASRATTSWQLK